MNEKEIKKQATDLFKKYKSDPKTAVLMLSAVISEAGNYKKRAFTEISSSVIEIIKALKLPKEATRGVPNQVLKAHTELIDNTLKQLQEYL